MATITLKGVPERLHAKLKSRARRNGRSLNREVIAALQQIVRDEEPSAAEWLEQIDALRERVKVRLTPAEIERYREHGRK